MPRPSRDDRTGGIIRLALAALSAGLIWLLVLPRVGALAPVRQFVRSNEAAGINPSAVYYTEVEAMGAVGERVETGGRTQTRRVDKLRK